jgi:hypothetical protein
MKDRTGDLSHGDGKYDYPQHPAFFEQNPAKNHHNQDTNLAVTHRPPWTANSDLDEALLPRAALD